jgi:hypothetical protein
VTVELAAAIPLLVAVTLAMVSLLGLARDQVLAQGAAGWERCAAKVAVVAAGPHRVQVSVELPVGLPFGVRPVAVRATAVAAREPGPSPIPANQ